MAPSDTTTSGPIPTTRTTTTIGVDIVAAGDAEVVVVSTAIGIVAVAVVVGKHADGGIEGVVAADGLAKTSRVKHPL